MPTKRIVEVGRGPSATVLKAACGLSWCPSELRRVRATGLWGRLVLGKCRTKSGRFPSQVLGYDLPQLGRRRHVSGAGICV